jgi:eukaryotic-like serine/threonine-protein kinase
MQCPHCGQEHPDSIRFCPSTGQPIIAAPRICPICGWEVKAEWTRCPHCAAFLQARPSHFPDFRLRSFLPALLVVLIILGIGGTILGSLLISRNNKPADQTESARTTIPTSASPALTPLITPTVPTNTVATATLETKTPIVIVTDTPEFKINIDSAELVFVPSGEFTMGMEPDPDPNKFWGAEAPSHRVSLESYYIYRTEVTNAMYQACVAAKACPKPEANNSRTRENYFENPEYSNYPVILISWVGAVSYCQWAEARLPTEAEWEKAARGGDERYFPWGNGPVAGDLANFCDQGCPASLKEFSLDDGYQDTAPVGNYPAGVSPYGALDMAGNVWEWVSDYFSEGYYQVSAFENPLGPGSGSRRVVRGGSWFNPGGGIRTVARASQRPNTALDTVGFRCAVDAP